MYKLVHAIMYMCVFNLCMLSCICVYVKVSRKVLNLDGSSEYLHNCNVLALPRWAALWRLLVRRQQVGFATLGGRMTRNTKRLSITTDLLNVCGNCGLSSCSCGRGGGVPSHRSPAIRSPASRPRPRTTDVPLARSSVRKTYPKSILKALVPQKTLPVMFVNIDSNQTRQIKTK
jgi:hypothetical protein